MTLPFGKPPTRAARKYEWAPRMWEGCDFFGWWRLLARNRFAVERPYWYIAVIVTFISLFHTVLRQIQELLYGEEIAAVPIREAPVFIVGHWRTGTTLLHELLVQDERHAFPNTYECLDPNHFLLTEAFFRRWLRFLVPSRRPMDNMAAGWERPQEDEFALCMLGVPSPYLTVAFPNHPPQYQEYLDLERLPPRDLKRWKTQFLRFLQQLTWKKRKRLILKSPTHSFRIKILLEMFPDARFVHIVRDPMVVFPSTLNLWKSLHSTQGLQRPEFACLEESVFSTFLALYAKLEEGKKHVRPRRFHEIRYEDLIRDPVAQMRRLYDHLELGDFARVEPRLRRYVATISGYETNHYDLSPDMCKRIALRWREVIHRYGYEKREARSEK